MSKKKVLISPEIKDEKFWNDYFSVLGAFDKFVPESRILREIEIKVVSDNIPLLEKSAPYFKFWFAKTVALELEYFGGEAQKPRNSKDAGLRLVPKSKKPKKNYAEILLAYIGIRSLGPFSFIEPVTSRLYNILNIPQPVGKTELQFEISGHSKTLIEETAGYFAKRLSDRILYENAVMETWADIPRRGLKLVESADKNSPC